MILAADDQPELSRSRLVETAWPAVRFAIGVHPHAAGTFVTEPSAAAAAVESAMDGQPLARAVGEIGLDYHYDYAPRAVQQLVFRHQIRLARERRLPIVIHTREADDDTFQILDEESAGDVGGVFHCFTGGVDRARRALDLGFYLSLAGIVSFPKATDLHDVARMVPLNRLLVETDSPFLAPVPHRGKRNEPSFVVEIASAIAVLRSLEPSVVQNATTRNFERLFNP